MEKKIIERLKELKQEVTQLPDNYYSEKDFKEYNNSDNKEIKENIIDRIETKFDKKNKLYRKILAFFRANFEIEKNEEYFENLGGITFRPKGGMAFNTFHYKNNEAWKYDKTRLINLLDLLENELQEKMITNKSTDKNNSFSETAMFTSALFWTIITVVGGVSYFLGLYKAEFDKSNLEKELKTQELKYQKLQQENNELQIKVENFDRSQ